MSFDPSSPPISLNRKDLRLVVLNCPYDTIHTDETKALYARLLDMKIKSYLAEYPYGANPIDGTDIFATHLLLCQVTPSGLEPLMGMKSVTLDRCQTHNHPFPVFGLIKDLKDHEIALRGIVEDAARKGERIAYNGSWAIHPQVRTDKFLRAICREISVFYLIQYYAEYKIPQVLAGATLRFKVEAYKEFVGYEYLSLQGQKLDSFECVPFFKERVALMHLSKIRDEALRWADKFLPLWKNRLVIERSIVKSEDSKVA